MNRYHVVPRLKVVSRGQTPVRAGHYCLQYKRPARIGSGTVHSGNLMPTPMLLIIWQDNNIL